MWGRGRVEAEREEVVGRERARVGQGARRSVVGTVGSARSQYCTLMDVHIERHQ